MACCWRASISHDSPSDATNSVVPTITATTTAGRNMRRATIHTTTTLAALISAEPIAVPRYGDTLVNGASTSSCSGPRLFTGTPTTEEPDDHAPSSGWWAVRTSAERTVK